MLWHVLLEIGNAESIDIVSRYENGSRKVAVDFDRFDFITEERKRFQNNHLKGQSLI